MNRFTVLTAIALLWAAIYLPGLGGAELKGEEGRRILPGLTMLESGNWVVPYLNGEPYLRKPPLINWLVAFSVQLTGERTEFAVRLPSVLATLALALTVAWTGSRWLGTGGGFVAAVFILVNATFLEKGRLAEIEAVYISLTGIAFAWWLAAWANRETGWRLWLVPGVMLGLGLLAKGPTHLLLFYGLIIPILVAAKEKRQLWSLAHLGSLALAIAIFAAWMVPHLRAAAELDAAGIWAEQIGERLGRGSLKLSEWLPNLPRALSNGLPWILFAALWWNKRVLDALGQRDERLRLLVRAARWPLFILFAGLMLIPGMLPRYTLPLYPAMALLLALVVPYAAPGWRRGWEILNRGLIVVVLAGLAATPWLAGPAALGGQAVAGLAGMGGGLLLAAFWTYRRGQGEPVRLSAGTALCVAGAMGIYSLALLPRISLEDNLRPVGERVNGAVPAGTTLYVVDPGYEPSLFYVHRRCVFVPSAKKLPPEAVYVLARGGDLKKIKSKRAVDPDALHLSGKGKKEFFLLKLSPESEKTPRPSRAA